MKFDIIESNHCVFFVYYTQKLFFLFLGFPDLKKIKVFSIIRCDRGRVLVNSQFLVSLAAQHWKQGSQKNRSEVWFIWGLFGIQSCFLNFLTALYVSVFFFSRSTSFPKNRGPRHIIVQRNFQNTFCLLLYVLFLLTPFCTPPHCLQLRTLLTNQILLTT